MQLRHASGPTYVPGKQPEHCGPSSVWMRALPSSQTQSSMLSLPAGAVDDCIQGEHSRLADVFENVLMGHAAQVPTPVEDLLFPGEQGAHARPFSMASYPARHSQSVISALAWGDEVLAGQALQASILSAIVEMPLKVLTGDAKQESEWP